jgi:hypothetical protein
VRWNDEAQNACQNQHGRENSQSEKVKVIENHRGSPFFDKVKDSFARVEFTE